MKLIQMILMRWTRMNHKIQEIHKTQCKKILKILTMVIWIQAKFKWMKIICRSECILEQDQATAIS